MNIYSISQIKERVTPVAKSHGVRRVKLFDKFYETIKDEEVLLHGFAC